MHHQSTRSLPFIQLITFISVYLSNFRCFSRCLFLAFSFCFFYGFVATPFGIFLCKGKRQYVTNAECQCYVHFYYFTVSKVEQEVSPNQSAFLFFVNYVWWCSNISFIFQKFTVYALRSQAFMVFAVQDQNVRNKESAFRHLRVNI